MQKKGGVSCLSRPEYAPAVIFTLLLAPVIGNAFKAISGDCTEITCGAGNLFCPKEIIAILIRLLYGPMIYMRLQSTEDGFLKLSAAHKRSRI